MSHYMLPSPSGRALALRALLAWSRGDISQSDVPPKLETLVNSKERALAHELILGVIRWQSRLDSLLTRILHQPLAELQPTIHIILRLGLYQLSFLTRIPAYAVVNESVEFSRREGYARAAGLVNAALRRYLRQKEALDAQLNEGSPDNYAHRFAHPQWIVDAFSRIRSEDAVSAWLSANNEIPPLTLSCHTPTIDRLAFMSQLELHGLDPTAGHLSETAVHLRTSGNVTQIPGFDAGWFFVQDEAAQLCTRLAGALPGETVLDACAAPGGKALLLSTLVGPSGTVYATDVSGRRLKKLQENLARLTIQNVKQSVHNWTLDDNDGSLAPRSYDRVLLDAPCSGLGVIRRIPEIKWRRSPEELIRYQTRQLELLRQLAKVVKKGGTLLYCVCSPLPEEGKQVIAQFISQHADFVADDLQRDLERAGIALQTDEGTLTTFPDRDGCDAFFAARLRRDDSVTVTTA